MEQTDIIVIGAGLTGLALAQHLAAEGRDVKVLETRDRLGGRILNQNSPGGAAYDLGPAWIWPHNRRMRALVDQLGVETFPQFAEGRLIHEDTNGRIRRDLDFAPMASALRIRGGLGAVTAGLASRIGAENILTGHRVTRIAHRPEGVTITTEHRGAHVTVQARHAVVTLPPRLAMETIAFTPDMPKLVTHALADIPTWMASHAKLVAIYKTPFWRETGLSGDVISQRGPLAEVHDASPANGSEGALFGFVGVPPTVRYNPDLVRKTAVDQLARLFGAEAATPEAVLWTDWAHDPATATKADWAPLTSHPTYGMQPALALLKDSRLTFTGTELAPEEGGFLEGALAAAEWVLSDLCTSLPVTAGTP